MHKLSTRLAAVFISLPLWLPSPCFGVDSSPRNPTENRNCDILLIGNSLTFYNSMPDMLKDMLNAGSERICEVKSIAIGGATLEQMEMLPAVSEAISGRAWATVVLQEQSARPLEKFNAMLIATRKLKALIDPSGAKVMLFVTWARKGQAHLQPQVNAAYARVASEINAELAPAGTAWQRFITEHPDGNLYAPDGLHPSKLGSFLAACVLVKSMNLDSTECQSPRGDQLISKWAKHVNAAADEAVKDGLHK